MSQSDKAFYYKALKEAGTEFDRHYREYSTAELKAAYDALPPWQAVERVDPVAPEPVVEEPVLRTSPAAPLKDRDPNEMAGQRLNSKDEDEPIRTDEQGRVWYQEEVTKPSYPKPRGRRVLTYMDSGVQQQTVTNGQYQETFEVAGDPSNARPAEVKITLPSYQVGIYRDPRFPFKVHTYNGLEGFDLFEVQEYWGGAELVPAEVKRIYVENVLCYDIRTTVRAIESEYRRLQLAGKV